MNSLKGEDSHQNDVSLLQKVNSELLAHNIELQREVSALKEQLLALRAELEGRGVGCANDACDTDNGTVATRRIPSWRPTGTLLQPPPLPSQPSQPLQQQPAPRAPPRHGLSRAHVERYSRHLLLPAFGVAAQERLCRGSVLVVGCGGLGSPVAMYLAAAGVGRLGLVDHDAVDVTNLHRQVMHSTGRVGMAKAVSGRLSCAAINPTIQVEAHVCGFSPANALQLTDQYDVVVDASDNPATRYLVSDACVVSDKPLVSAAAVGTDGQLTVYHYGQDGPCYRCLFPESPAPENCSRCGEAGVLGVVPGIMGCLQALEAVKILAGVGDVSSKKMTILDGLAGRFTTVRLRGRSPSCVACGSAPAISRASLPSYDYVMFTGQPPDDGPPEELKLVDPRVRLSPGEVAKLLVAGAEAAAAASGSDAIGAQEPASDQGAGADADAGGGGVSLGTAPAASGAPAVAAVAAVVASGPSEAAGRAAGGRFGVSPSEGGGPLEGPGESSGGDGGDGGGGGGGDGGCDLSGASGGVSGAPRTVFLDVRPQTQYDIMALPGVVHVPYERLEARLAEVLALCGASSLSSAAPAVAAVPGSSGGKDGDSTVPGSGPSSGVAHATVSTDGVAGSVAVGDRGCGGYSGCAGGGKGGGGGPAPPRLVVLCRRGNNSQRVVARLAALGVEGVTDMRGGYQAWAREVDPDMPLL